MSFVVKKKMLISEEVKISIDIRRLIYFMNILLNIH